jgi:spermidine synthase
MAYLMLRGAPLAGLCLGRVGKTFSHAEVSLIESSLGALAVAWVSFHVPWKGKPLREMSVFDRLRASLHRDIVIRDRNGFREMVAGDLVWTRAKLDEPSRSGWFYVDLFHIVAGTASNRSRALFIGCGGAVGIRRFAEVYPGIAIDVVEIDARVVDLAMRWFDFGSIPNVQVHIADGHDFISRVHSSYDIIITDGYDATTTSLGSSTFFTSARRALREGGAMGFNAIGALSGSIQSFELAARAAFEHVRLVPVLDPGEAFSPEDTRNVLIVAQS